MWRADPLLRRMEAASGSHRGSFHKLFAELHKEEALRVAQYKKDHRRPPTKPQDPPTCKRRDALRYAAGDCLIVRY